MFFHALLLLAVGAYAAAEDKIPNYHKAVQDYDVAKRIVLSLSKPHSPPLWKLPSAKRDYIQLVAFIDAITKNARRNTNYVLPYYGVLNETVPIAWQNPGKVVEDLEKGIKKVDDAIAIVRELVDKYCGTSRSAVLNDVECNTFVDLEVKKKIDYLQSSAAVLVSLGDLAATYLSEPYGSKAHSYDMISFLLNDKGAVLKLVVKLGNLKELMSRSYSK